MIKEPRVGGQGPLVMSSHEDKKKKEYNINLLTPSGFFRYHQVEHSKILHGARFALSVLYGYQNRQRLLLYTSLND